MGTRNLNTLRVRCQNGEELDVMRHDIKTVTFAALTTGAIASKELFKVTGLIMATVIPICTTNVTGGGSIVLGNETVTNQFIDATVGTDIDAGEFWLAAIPATYAVNADSLPLWCLLSGTDIGYTVSIDTLTDGVITFHVYWYPISEGATLTVAGTNVTL